MAATNYLETAMNPIIKRMLAFFLLFLGGCAHHSGYYSGTPHYGGYLFSRESYYSKPHYYEKHHHHDKKHYQAGSDWRRYKNKGDHHGHRKNEHEFREHSYHQKHKHRKRAYFKGKAICI